MGNGDATFKVITNDDIYAEVQDCKKMLQEITKKVAKVQQQVKWHQRIAIVVLPAYGSVLWYILTMGR